LEIITKAGSFEHRCEASLLEMLIASKGLGDAFLPHKNE